MRKTLKIVMTAVAIIGIVGSLLTGCGAKPDNPDVKLNNYMVIKIEGTDGNGAITKMELNYEKLAEDFGKGQENAEEIFKDNCPTLALTKSNENEEQKTEGLSNDDTLVFTWEGTKDGVELIEETFNIDVVYSNFVYMVSGLEDAQESANE